MKVCDGFSSLSNNFDVLSRENWWNLGGGMQFSFVERLVLYHKPFPSSERCEDYDVISWTSRESLQRLTLNYKHDQAEINRVMELWFESWYDFYWKKLHQYQFEQAYKSFRLKSVPSSFIFILIFIKPTNNFSYTYNHIIL